MSVSRFSRKELSSFFQTAQRILRHHAFDILAKPRVYSDARLLIVTSRRVGTAVNRNRIRRRLKHIFHEEQLFKNDYDYIIVIKKPALDMSFEQLKHLLCNTLSHHTSTS